LVAIANNKAKLESELKRINLDISNSKDKITELKNKQESLSSILDEREKSYSTMKAKFLD
jgi:chromosome segregation ATPase